MSQSRIAIVAVHGIGPAQRYALQDEVAENLAARLPGQWSKAAFFPPSGDGLDALHHGSALRLSQDDEHAEHDVVFDVYEGYWSPIDKNRTSVPSVLSWLLNSLFAPLNAVTPLPARGKKLAFDLVFVFVAIALVFLLPLAAIAVFGTSYADFSADRFSGREVSLFGVLRLLRTNVPMLRYGLEVHYLLSMVLGAAGWYIIAHVAISFLTSLRMRRGSGKEAHQFAWQQKMRLLAVMTGAALIAFSWSVPAFRHERFAFHWEPLLLLGVALLIRLALALAKDFFVNRLGDIQIYATGDHNSTHYYLRERILEAVESTLARVLTTEEGGSPYYERVYVVAHSLGSTIAMDALIHLYQAVEAHELSRDAWDRIKAFVTLGTALEKTKFFFGSRNPSLTESFQHWRDDVYGRLFSRDPASLERQAVSGAHTIFWANYWYFRDVVANKVSTYRASADQGGDGETDICFNVRLRERGKTFFDNPWVHSDYLGDPHFWSGVDYKGEARIGVTEILTSGRIFEPATVAQAV